MTADLNATADYAKKIPAANGKLAVSGFCWGGGQSFRFATNRKDLSAAFVFYGPDRRTYLPSPRRFMVFMPVKTPALARRSQTRRPR